MNAVYSYTLILHITAGFAALLTGLIGIVSRKGQQLHRLNGKIYFWAMLTVAITAALMSIVKDLDFFLMLSVFSFYAAYSGYRAIRNKLRRANWLDWTMVIGSVITFSYMIISRNVILITFGTIFGLFLFRDIKDFTRKEPKPIQSKYWLIVHIGRMLGAYIATVTAFLVVNFGSILHDNWNLIVWLGPTAIGVPLIFYWIRRQMGKAIPA